MQGSEGICPAPVGFSVSELERSCPGIDDKKKSFSRKRMFAKTHTLMNQCSFVL